MSGDSEDPPAELVEVVVPPEAAGMRLDVFLAGLPAIAVRSRAKRLAQLGAALVDGRRGKPGTFLEAGQAVTVRLIPDTEGRDAGHDPAEWPFQLRVLYQDAWIVVIDKPPGLATHRPDDPRHPAANVADLAGLHFDLAAAAGPERPGIVHRLDKETSGVMVLACTDEAYHSLKAQFRARTVGKEYRAIVWGVPRFDSDWIERNIAVHPRQGDRMVTVKEGGRVAATFYAVVERFARTAYVRCCPKTGRTHQIRVHMASIGHSLVGDRMYRSRNAQALELPEDAPAPGRHCLHARRLTFDHPKTGERVTFDAPLPEDLDRLLDWLRRNP